LLISVVVIAAGAFAVRFLLLADGGGLHGLQGYDDGVYFTAADAFVHGRWPYRDFVLLHPPGIVVALSPFAALGSLTSDATGLAVARLAFMAIGALNAVLVYALVRRCGQVAGVAAGLFYALWFPAAYPERVTLLEPLGTLTLLVALVLLQRGSVRGLDVWAAGAALGACLAVKIWDIVPVLVVIGWAMLHTGRRTWLRLWVSTAAVAALLYEPFLVTAPFELSAWSSSISWAARSGRRAVWSGCIL
jgi:alpha-1,2-mannosyltransferase